MPSAVVRGAKRAAEEDLARTPGEAAKRGSEYTLSACPAGVNAQEPVLALECRLEVLADAEKAPRAAQRGSANFDVRGESGRSRMPRISLLPFLVAGGASEAWEMLSVRCGCVHRSVTRSISPRNLPCAPGTRLPNAAPGASTRGRGLSGGGGASGRHPRPAPEPCDSEETDAVRRSAACACAMRRPSRGARGIGLYGTLRPKTSCRSLWSNHGLSRRTERSVVGMLLRSARRCDDPDDTTQNLNLTPTNIEELIFVTDNPKEKGQKDGPREVEPERLTVAQKQ